MKELIKENLFKYGFYPLLIVLKRMEDKSEYSICALIKEVIEEHNLKYKLELPTKLSFKAVIEMKIAFMLNFNLMGDIAYKNSEYYADEIEKSINLYERANNK